MRKHKFNRPLTVAFNEAMYADIKAISDSQEMSMAEWVRGALDKVFDDLKDTGIKHIAQLKKGALGRGCS